MHYRKELKALLDHIESLNSGRDKDYYEFGYSRVLPHKELVAVCYQSLTWTDNESGPRFQKQ